MIQNRLTNGLSSSRKQQTAVKHTVDRPKTKSWYNDSVNYRHHPYPPPSLILNRQIINEDQNWSKSSTKTSDDTPELELTCQEETLSEVQLKNYPTQAYDPTAPLPLPAVRKRTTVLKKLPTQDIEILQDPDEDFVPSESEEDDDDDDDENYLPEHDRRPYHRSNHVNGTVGRGRGRGGRGHLTSTNSRLPPSTHFVRPQPELPTSHSRLQHHSLTGVHRHRDRNSVENELERTYPTALTRYYGTRNGQTINSSDYGEFHIKCSICGEESSNNMSFVAHLCSHFEDDLNYISPFDKIYRQCSICHAEFSTPFQTFLHKDQQHMVQMNEYRCRICQQNHQNLRDLFSHLNSIHNGLDMPYTCDRCNYRTSIYEDMAHHIRQIHKNTQYFFCPYCFQAVILPPLIDTNNVLNSTPAVRHVILHFDRIENSNNKQQQRRIESLFKYCNRCLLHVKSLKEHYNYHHPSNTNLDGEKSFVHTEENNFKTNNHYHHHQMNDVFHNRSYPMKFDRTKQLPMATIRRRQTPSNNYETIHSNNQWYSRR